MMRAAVATYDTKARAIRLEVTAGLHVNVCCLLTPAAARALVAELDAAIKRTIGNVETKPSELPKPRLPDDYIAECEPAGTRDR